MTQLFSFITALALLTVVPPATRWAWCDRFRFALAAMFLFTGVWHFVKMDEFVQLVPDGIPLADAAVGIIGAVEIVVALLLAMASTPRLRRQAAWGVGILLVALYFFDLNYALSPAGIVDDSPFNGLVARTAIQLIFLVAAWIASGKGPAWSRPQKTRGDRAELKPTS